MSALPPDVWIMMIFSIFAFFGVALWALVYTLRQEERKMKLLESEGDIDTHSPTALHELREWIDSHPDDPDVEEARETYQACVNTLRSTDHHYYNWSAADIDQLVAR